MRFDLSGCGAGLDELARTLLELGPLAERLGYDGLWINEEHFGQGSRVCLSPILLATALAMRTRTIRIGFSVLVLPLFEPIRLAEEIATLDVLSEGRVDLGVSRGNTSRYFEAWGLDYEDRSAAFDGVFDRLIRYWTEAKVEVGSRTEFDRAEMRPTAASAGVRGDLSRRGFGLGRAARSHSVPGQPAVGRQYPPVHPSVQRCRR